MDTRTYEDLMYDEEERAAEAQEIRRAQVAARAERAVAQGIAGRGTAGQDMEGCSEREVADGVEVCRCAGQRRGQGRQGACGEVGEGSAVTGMEGLALTGKRGRDDTGGDGQGERGGGATGRLRRV